MAASRTTLAGLPRALGFGSSLSFAAILAAGVASPAAADTFPGAGLLLADDAIHTYCLTSSFVLEEHKLVPEYAMYWLDQTTQNADLQWRRHTTHDVGHINAAYLAPFSDGRLVGVRGRGSRYAGWRLRRTVGCERSGP